MPDPRQPRPNSDGPPQNAGSVLASDSSTGEPAAADGAGRRTPGALDAARRSTRRGLLRLLRRRARRRVGGGGGPAGDRDGRGRPCAASTAAALALRAGPVLEEAVRALTSPPDVLIVDATGRDHPRRAGLAVHLGAKLDLPTIGVTHRTRGAAAADRRSRHRRARQARTASADPRLDGDGVGAARPAIAATDRGPRWRAPTPTRRSRIVMSIAPAHAHAEEPLRARHAAAASRLARVQLR